MDMIYGKFGGVTSLNDQEIEVQRKILSGEIKQQVPVTLVEHMTDPRAAQLQMLFASLDERGKKTIVALAATMARLHKDGYHG